MARRPDPYLDPEPLHRPLRLLLKAEYGEHVTVVNPFGAVVTQNKLSLALMWEAMEKFSPQARRWIQPEHADEREEAVRLDDSRHAGPTPHRRVVLAPNSNEWLGPLERQKEACT